MHDDGGDGPSDACRACRQVTGGPTFTIGALQRPEPGAPACATIAG